MRWLQGVRFWVEAFIDYHGLEIAGTIMAIIVFKDLFEHGIRDLGMWSIGYKGVLGLGICWVIGCWSTFMRGKRKR